MPTKFGVATNNLVTFVDNYGGKQTEVFNGVDFAINARLAVGSVPDRRLRDRQHAFQPVRCVRRQSRDRLRPVCGGGGPAAPSRHRVGLLYCDFDTSWLTQAKVTGSYTLPWQQIQIGGVLQNLPGQQILAQWNITQADAAPALGRAAVGRRQHLARRAAHQAGDDVHAAPDADRPARLEELPAGRDRKRLQVMADIFNAFNSNAAVGATSNAGEPPAAINTTYSRVTRG